MNRINSISKFLKAVPTNSNTSPPTNTVINELIEKVQIILPHLIMPTWILSPLFCGYLLKFGSFDTRLNLFLLLIYQYFFVRKTKILREMLFHMKGTQYFKDYKLIIEDSQELEDSAGLFTFHPHGYFATGLYLAHISHNVIKNNEICGSRMAFYYPWGGLMMKFLGLEGANPSNFEALMKIKKNISIIPGGFEEATLTLYGKDRIYLKNRKGFIKLAMRHGYHIYPVYTFGETNMLYSLSNEKLGLFLNKIKLPGIIPYSKNLILPNNNENLLTVIGKKIEVPQNDKPSQEMIDKFHAFYVENLKRIFNKYKRIGDGDLEIF